MGGWVIISMPLIYLLLSLGSQFSIEEVSSINREYETSTEYLTNLTLISLFVQKSERYSFGQLMFAGLVSISRFFR